MFRIVFAALFLVLFGVVGTYRRKAQEGRPQLEDRFGQEYRDCVSRTGRFLPRWST